MPGTVRMPALLSMAVLLLAGCRHLTPVPRPPAVLAEPLPPGALLPSQNLLVGRVFAIDLARGFAFVEVSASAPAAALAAGAELVTRTDDLQATARLRVSRYVRGRTLAATIVSGQPAPGHEAVWPAP